MRLNDGREASRVGALDGSGRLASSVGWDVTQPWAGERCCSFGGSPGGPARTPGGRYGGPGPVAGTAERVAPAAGHVEAGCGCPTGGPGGWVGWSELDPPRPKPELFSQNVTRFHVRQDHDVALLISFLGFVLCPSKRKNI